MSSIEEQEAARLRQNKIQELAGHIMQGAEAPLAWSDALRRAAEAVDWPDGRPMSIDDFPSYGRSVSAMLQTADGHRTLTITIPDFARPQSIDYLAELVGMWDLHIRKATGYSGHSNDVWANFRTMERLGVPDELGAYIRMNDKFNRLTSLLQKPERDLVDEPIEDLLDDIAAYAMIAKRLRAEERARGA